MGNGISSLAQRLRAGLLLSGVGVALLVLVAGSWPAPTRAAPVPARAVPSTFLVQDPGLAILGPDGREKERLDRGTNGALSPDGRRLASIEFERNADKGKLVIRPRGEPGEPATVPMVWGTLGTSGCRFVWSADGGRVLIGKNRPGEYAYRVYDLAANKVTDLKLPDGHDVTGWSADGKRFLATARTGGAGPRVAWLNADGTGTPEFLTPEDEVAYDARLSPDGRRMLYLAGPRPPKGERARVRLHVMDLTTRKRVPVDEPGETHGHCWSPDGSRIAYTWQRTLDKPNEVPVRETHLFTCDPDGKKRETVTSRKYEEPGSKTGPTEVVYFFWVHDWR